MNNKNAARTGTLAALLVLGLALVWGGGPARAGEHSEAHLPILFTGPGPGGATHLVSMGFVGGVANGGSNSAALSADGRFVAFASTARNLVSGPDRNGGPDIFVYDRQTGLIDLISAAADGNPGSLPSDSPSISADGRYVVFRSHANDLVPNDNNHYDDLFVHDRRTGRTSLIALGSDGEQPYGVYAPVISANGRFVAFISERDNMVDGDTNQATDVFVHDRQSGTTSRVSVASDGEQGNEPSFEPAISADGRFVAFTSIADNLVEEDTNKAHDIFVHDRQTGETSRVSVNSAGEQAHFFNSEQPALSADGRYVAFASSDPNLVPGTGNGWLIIFVHDRLTGETSRVTAGLAGEDPDGGSFWPAFSADGRFLTFASDASNLVAGDTNGVVDICIHDRETSRTSRVSAGPGGEQANAGSYYAPAISADGRTLAFATDADNLIAVPQDTNETTDLILRDRQTGALTLVSQDANPRKRLANEASDAPAVSADGRFVAFESLASNLVAGDTNGLSDIFVHDRQARQTTRVSLSSGGAQADGASTLPAISADGHTIAFLSTATNLVGADSNMWPDVFVHDRRTGQTIRASRSSAGVQANGESYAVALSADGRFVAFASAASNLVPGDSNGKGDIFIFDRQTYQTSRVSLAANGAQADNVSGEPAISGDGRFVAFTSEAANLVPGDSNTVPDVFVHDRQTGETWRVSVSSEGEQGDKGSGAPAISAGGRFVAFDSAAGNLAPADAPLLDDVFVHDRETGETSLVSTNWEGGQPNGTSLNPDISADGRFVVFESTAVNLLTENPYPRYRIDLYVRDRWLGRNSIISLTPGGEPASEPPEAPALAANGRFTAFVSRATNLDPDGYGHFPDIFIHDSGSPPPAGP